MQGIAFWILGNGRLLGNFLPSGIERIHGNHGEKVTVLSRSQTTFWEEFVLRRILLFNHMSTDYVSHINMMQLSRFPFSIAEETSIASLTT